MSYIELPQGNAASSKEFIISLWFRIPHSTIAAARADSESQSNDSVLAGIVPLIVLGSRPQVTGVESVSGTGGAGVLYADWQFNDHDPDSPRFQIFPGYPQLINTGTQEWVPTAARPGTPAYIGIDCTTAKPVLDVNLAMPIKNKAKMDGGIGYSIPTGGGASAMLGLYLGDITNCQVVAGGPLATSYTISSVSDHSAAELALGGTPETFRTCLPGGPTEQGEYTGPEITPDHWHHLLLSFDLTGSVALKGKMTTRSSVAPCIEPGGNCGIPPEGSSTVPGKISRACKMYIALDDDNLTGKRLTAYRNDDSDENDIITVNGKAMLDDEGFNINDVSCVRFGRQETVTLEVAIPTYTYRPDAFNFGDRIIGLPVNSALAGNVSHHVEMAELQIFTGVSIDTGSAGNRRAFITDKGKPAAMSKAEKLLGREPDVKIHGSSNWKKAINTGALGSDTVELGGAGPGVPFGEIDTYRPNPNLFGEQGVPQ